VITDLRRWAPAVLAIRALVVGSGAVALLVAPGGEFVVAGMIALVGVVGLAAGAVRPDAGGPAFVLGAAVVAWVLRYGEQPPSTAPTLVLAVAMAVHHQSAALAAALPPTANVDTAVLIRFGVHAAVVLVLSGAIAVLALEAARPGGSVPLELAGLLAVALVVAVPVLLSRRP
jgi:hypothetical protein